MCLKGYILYIFVYKVILVYSLRHTGTWHEVQRFCNISSEDYRHLLHDLYDIDGVINQYLPVWTDTTVAVSDWTDFDGCLDVKVNKGNSTYIHSRLRQLFKRGTSIKLPNAFECAFHCTDKTRYFIYFESFCLCVNQLQYKKKLTFSCVVSCLGYNVNADKLSVYCSSGYGLPVFKFIQGLEEKIDRAYDDNHHYQCLIRQSKRTEVVNCLSNYNFLCKQGKALQKQPIYGIGTWKAVVDVCVNANRSLYQKSHQRNFTSWLSPFRMLNASQSGSKCLALVSSRTGKELTQLFYQYRKCSDKLPPLCTNQLEDTNSSLPITVAFGSGLLHNVTSGIFETMDTTKDSRDWLEGNIHFIIATVVIAVLIIVVMTLSRVICQLKKKFKVALYTNLIVDREHYPYSDRPRFQQSIRSYAEILPMSPIVHSENDPSFAQDITQQTITEAEGCTTPKTHDEMGGTELYQLIT